jgi:hypothetical protein
MMNKYFETPMMVAFGRATLLVNKVILVMAHWRANETDRQVFKQFESGVDM